VNEDEKGCAFGETFEALQISGLQGARWALGEALDDRTRRNRRRIGNPTALSPHRSLS
jgi:hypothetical protein